MLCSFMSIDDFVSFIYSPKFVNLINTEIPVKFEIGLYTRHEIILDMNIENNLIVLTDSEIKIICRSRNAPVKKIYFLRLIHGFL